MNGVEYTKETGQANSVVRNVLLLSKNDNLVFPPSLVFLNQLFDECDPNHTQTNNYDFLPPFTAFINQSWWCHRQYPKSRTLRGRDPVL